MHWQAVPRDTALGREIARADDFDLLGRDDPNERGAGDIQISTSHCTDLTLGVIDHRATGLYGHGDCAALALAVHENTGWALALVRFDQPRPDGKEWLHAVAVRPDGLLVDIWGARPEQAVLDYWEARGDQGLTVEPVGVRAFTATCGSLDDLDPFSREVTRHFAATLLEDLDV